MSVIKQKQKNPLNLTKESETSSLNAVDLILAIILGVIVIVMFAQVIFRYAFNNSLTWSEEIVRFLFIWLTFLGSSILIKDKWHIGVDFFVDLFPSYWKKRIQLIDTLFTVSFLVFLSITGFLLMYLTRETLSSALGLPQNLILYGALPISSLFGIFFGIRRAVKEIKEIKKESNIL